MTNAVLISLRNDWCGVEFILLLPFTGVFSRKAIEQLWLPAKQEPVLRVAASGRVEAHVLRSIVPPLSFLIDLPPQINPNTWDGDATSSPLYQLISQL